MDTTTAERDDAIEVARLDSGATVTPASAIDAEGCHEPWADAEPDLAVLDEIQRRVLWLAVRMVDSANHDRESGDGVKVGGHQASSASVVSLMTALYLAHLGPDDRVSVKPHASPVLHAIQYLLGRLDRSYLTTLRAAGGLQSYPSRTKDPDPIDFSTGSVGLGVAAPLFAALVRRYVDDHFGRRAHSRFVAIVGDAELDEGNVWEAVAEVATAGLGNVLWVVDLNRQSLDRVVSGVRAGQWMSWFEAMGWHVVQAKYGGRLRRLLDGPGGDRLRHWLDSMSNEWFQSLFALTGAELRDRFLDGAPEQVRAILDGVPDEELADLLRDLGGHDLDTLLSAFRECDRVTDRPSVVFAYTVKGWGLPLEGHPRNHSALMSTDQVARLREATGLTEEAEWDGFDPESPAGRWLAHRADVLTREPRRAGLPIAVPRRTDTKPPGKPVSTQETFGRVLTSLARDPDVAPYLVTVAPDVATSTNLAGYINKVGVYSPVARPDWGGADGLVRWREHPGGQHIELGIAEMNLFLLLGQLGLSWDLSGQTLLPVGTVYDPFVCRGLDAFIYGLYSGASFVVAGTPSGVTLAPEGGAHQSTVTASLGLELPGVTSFEPAYAGALDLLLCDAVRRMAAGEKGAASYFRLSTRPIDNAPFEAARVRLGPEVQDRAVLAGAYPLVDASHVEGPTVYLVGCGAVLPEVVAAAVELQAEGVRAHVVDVTSPDRLYAGWQSQLRADFRGLSGPRRPGHLRRLFREKAPVVTVHDSASHTMAWLGSALGVPAVPLGVDAFGQSGSVAELYELHDLAAGSIVNAALAALALAR